jgi:magnesium transporter
VGSLEIGGGVDPMSVEPAEPRPAQTAGTPDPGFMVGCLTRVDEKTIREHLERDQFFWLDLTSPSDEEIKRLGQILNFHPLAIEDTLHFDQRPKLDEYDGYVFMVFYGADERPDYEGDFLHEVHFFVSGQYLITVHRAPLPALDVQRGKLERQILHSEQFVLYRVIDALTDSFFPLLARMDDEIDELEKAMVENPTESQLQRVFALKRELVTLRKVITPQRDIFARSIDRMAELPGLKLDERDYFRDVYDHLIRISDMVDTYRELLSGATDLYLSTVSNRQNEVMKQLAIVGTIFLPLSFIVGFFGQNFGWLVTKAIAPAWTFWVFGMGSLLATCVLLFLFFKRKGWL